MVHFHLLSKDLQNKFTNNNLIPVTDGYFEPEEYKSLVIPDWNAVIEEFIQKCTKEKIEANPHGKESYPCGDLQYKEGGASFYFCKLFDTLDLNEKRIAVIGSEKPWIEAIVYNYGCRNITTIEYNKPNIDHENFKVISFEEFKNSEEMFDYIFSYSSIEHSGLGRYGDEINPDGDLETMDVINNHLTDNGFIGLGIPIGKDTLVWNANRIYGKYRLPLLLEKFNIIEWFGGDESCLDIIPMCNGKFAYQPILLCRKK